MEKDDIRSSFFVGRQRIAEVVEPDRLPTAVLCARFG
jgi:hypothetical protein